MKFLLICTLCLFTFCSKQIKENKTHFQNHDFSDKKTEEGILKQSIEQPDTTKLIEGVWAKNEFENAIFQIIGNQLIYLEDIENPIDIEVLNGDIILKGDIVVHFKIIKLSNDSLWFKDGITLELTKLYKR
jgi:hypothetical protein